MKEMGTYSRAALEADIEGNLLFNIQSIARITEHLYIRICPLHVYCYFGVV